MSLSEQGLAQVLKLCSVWARELAPYLSDGAVYTANVSKIVADLTALVTSCWRHF